MCDFNILSEDEKKRHHETLLAYATQFGGINFFLQFLEAIRETKPHPLVSANSVFDIELGSITWNKVIFNDKLQLLLKARQNESKQDNFIPKAEEKNHKKILNVVRTLKPIVFHVKAAHSQEGQAFYFQAFETIDENKTKLNPLFDAFFFCSVESIKKILNYQAKD